VAAVVYDAEAPSSKRVVAELQRPEVRAQVYRLARWSTRSEIDAEDLVQDALVRVLDPEDAPWDPERRGFLTHMSFVMRQTWDQRGRAARARLEVITDGHAVDEQTLSREPPPDDEVERRRSLAVLRSLGERLLAAMGDDPLGCRIFELGATEGLYEPRELAERIPTTVEQAKSAIQRIKYHARRILDDWNMNEDRRMKGLREPATKWKQEDAP
jgi:DNA-directed RNA polymerase specialized sigma24 family protein